MRGDTLGLIGFTIRGMSLRGHTKLPGRNLPASVTDERGPLAEVTGHHAQVSGMDRRDWVR